MSDKYKAVYVPLSRDEFIALQRSAQGTGLHPRDQARFLLRTVLLHANSQPTNANIDTSIRQDNRVDVCT